MPKISEALYVEGVLVGAIWQFEGRCFVEDPPGSGTWRKATAGEVEVELKWLGEWWQIPKVLETKNTDALGNVSFAGSHDSDNYRMTARHIQSGDEYALRIECHDDGTYDVSVE
ncbi:unnamed protein product [marine sediment metagenome]|uniref:Uncharacterized protein n=1 Tax=marine sediment metagenome TaxID=412755 RepID=X1RYR0_9ZZZZ